MTLGLADRQGDLLDEVKRFCDETLASSSVYSVLHRERDRLFPDEMFADLFSERGRRSVPPSVVATVMVLQRLEGLSDREAVDRYSFDARWRYAAGVGGYGGEGWDQFAHTVLVDMRGRLAASEDPRRIFRVTVEAASTAGLVGAKRVLDSTPLYDAVATMDTITLIRSSVRSLLRVAGPELKTELRGALSSGDDYASSAKPQIDWDDAEACEALIDSLARDAMACLALLDGRALSAEVSEAAALVATILGQDLEETADGTFRIARRVARDRVISTVDPEARHGHKTSARGFDGYKGHVAIDPDSEIITDTVVSAGNAGDASVAEELLDDVLDSEDSVAEPDPPADAAAPRRATEPETADSADRPIVYGDAAYGTGELLHRLAEEGVESRCKTQPPTAPGGLWTKESFEVDLETDTVTCPSGVTVPIRRDAQGDGIARFGDACGPCPLRALCTRSEAGRSVQVGRYERHLAEARRKQQDPDWLANYRATRPKVERRLAHMMRRRHGGRRARVRGRRKVDADFNLLGAAQNLARLAVLGLRSTLAGWAVQAA